MPKLSVIIPTFNRLELLKRAVKSVQEQDFKDIEIIISDDHSNDGTKEFCENLIKQDSRIKYFLNEKYKKGPNGNKNNGLDRARGEFISFLDDDDELLKGALSTLLAKEKEGFSHIFGNCFLQRGEILSEEFSGRGLLKDCEVSKKDFLMQKFSGEFFSVFKKSLLEKKRFNDEFYGNEAVLWVNLYKERSFYIHKAFRIYRIFRQDSVTLGANANAYRVFLGYLEFAKIIENELKSTGDKDYKKSCASSYKMAAYYAKFSGNYKELYFCLFKSLSIKLNFPALILLILSIIPSKIIEKLSKFRVSLCKN